MKNDAIGLLLVVICVLTLCFAVQNLSHATAKINPTPIEQLLLPYTQYENIITHWPEQTSTSINAFLTTNVDTPLAARLRLKWLLHLADKHDWKNFLTFYQGSDSVTMQCLYLTALSHTGSATAALKQMPGLWLSGANRPQQCDELFAVWLQQTPAKQQLILQRIVMAMNKPNPVLVRHLMPMLNTSDKARLQQWLDLYREPQRLLEKNIKNDELGRVIVSSILTRLARRAPARVIELWPIVINQYNLSKQQKNNVIRTLAMRLSFRSDPRAEQWFNQIEPAFYDRLSREWRVRNAIAHQDWRAAQTAIYALTTEEQHFPCWQYWHGRVLEQLGDSQQAATIYRQLAQQRHYYGFLASQRNRLPLQINDKRLDYIDDEQQQINRFVGMQRAKALFTLNKRADAIAELEYLENKLSDRQKYIVAKTVAEWGWFEQAIVIAQHSHIEDDISLRFPLNYQDSILASAKQHQLNPALIYAVIRQESGFVQRAQSSAGALGLMQLMPQTAAFIAKETHEKITHHDQLFNPEMNIRLGSFYLKTMRDKAKNHPVAFLAAYNAGFTQVRYWLRTRQTEQVDIWIETLPWAETRNYIKNVIAYYVIYQYRLGMQPNIDYFFVNTHAAH